MFQYLLFSSLNLQLRFNNNFRITASLITAGAGTSLKTKCSQTEPLIMLIFLIITGMIVSLAKLFAPGGIKKNFGPTIVSFMLMFATGLALHQKPLICG